MNEKDIASASAELRNQRKLVTVGSRKKRCVALSGNNVVGGAGKGCHEEGNDAVGERQRGVN